MQLAAIDIGTNSIHMIVVRVRPDLSFEIVDREKDMVRLGAGGLDGRALTDAAIASGLQTLSKFKRLAESRGVDEILASATSAVREASNGGDFIRAVAERTGIRVRVISGTEEARLIHLAASYGVDVGGGTAVVIDIGGGSVEITCGKATDVRLARSFKIGVIRLTERFVKTDPLSGGDERRMVKHISKEIGAHVTRITEVGFDRVIGTSGTILSLGSLALTNGDAQASGDLRNQRVSGKQIHRLRKKLLELDLRERLDMPGLEPRRADLAVAGAVLLDTIVRRLGADEITLCDLALREGLVLDYINRNRAQIATVDRYPDLRRRSVIELGERCGYWSEHAQKVASIALSLFDQTRAVHGFGEREREWLEYGALLHDAGVHISYERHHRHSYYLVKHGDLRGFEPQEIEVVGLITRYHRRGTPKRTHEEFAALKKGHRNAVRTLSAIVRLAEALDRSHSQAIAGVDLVDRGEDYILRLRAGGDAELELWAAHRSAAPLEDALGKTIRFEVVSESLHLAGTESLSHVEQPDDAARVSRKTVRRRRHRRVRQDHAAGPAREVADRRRSSRVRHRVELVRSGESRHEAGQEEEHADADDVQPASRHRLR
jgi:exopolyphosphatase/guanosine-5'-triphosphate,3'-diphosphate pyrophosphatase